VRVKKHLSEIEEVLGYYLPNVAQSKTYFLYLREIAEFIEELSLEKKVNDAKVAKKIKQDIESSKKS